MYQSTYNLTKKYRLIAKLYSDLQSIDRSEDLRRRGLSLTDYHMVVDLFNRIQKDGFVLTISTKVAEYFKKFGFHVELDEEGVNYEITFP